MLLRSAFNMLLLAAVLYGAFFVPIGNRTLYAHLARIVSTQEAQELFGAVSGLVTHAKVAISSRL
jgi:hypothetical protein